MQQSVFSAMFGAMSQEWRLRSITNNLANVNTTGYKKDQLAFKDTFIQFAHDQIMEPVMNLRSKKLFPEPQHMARPRMALALTNFSQGSLKQTGNPLDLAITGDGFFKVNSDRGELYSRDGHFRVTDEGLLVTDQGYPVVGDGGNITLPPGAKPVINDSGQIYNGDELIGQIQLVTVENLAMLEKGGENLYQPRNGQAVNEIPAEDALVSQGFLEASNVNVVEEMVNMIETHRQFEAYQKMIQRTDELDKQAIQQVARVR